MGAESFFSWFDSDTKGRPEVVAGDVKALVPVEAAGTLTLPDETHLCFLFINGEPRMKQTGRGNGG